MSVCYWNCRFGFDSRSGHTKDYKNWYSQLICLTFGIERDNVKPPSCVVDKWAGGSLIRRPKVPFAVPWPKQLGKSKYNYHLELAILKSNWLHPIYLLCYWFVSMGIQFFDHSVYLEPHYKRFISGAQSRTW